MELFLNLLKWPKFSRWEKEGLFKTQAPAYEMSALRLEQAWSFALRLNISCAGEDVFK